MTQIKYGSAGQAGLQTDSFNVVEILAGDTPAQVTDYGLLQAGQVAGGIPAYTPVFVDPETRVVQIATFAVDASGIEANALTLCDIEAGTVAGASVPVWKAGCFNIRAINWHASYVTDGAKFGAFARTMGNQIVIKKQFNDA